MSEPEKCNKCDGIGYYYTIEKNTHLCYRLPLEGIKTECDCTSLLHKYNRLLEFVKSIDSSLLTDDELSRYMEYSSPCEQFQMSLVLKARALLKEIGEL